MITQVLGLKKKEKGESRRTLKGLRTGERKGEGNRSGGACGGATEVCTGAAPSPGSAQPDAAAPGAEQPGDAETEESRPARAWTPGALFSTRSAEGTAGVAPGLGGEE